MKIKRCLSCLLALLIAMGVILLSACKSSPNSSGDTNNKEDLTQVEKQYGQINEGKPVTISVDLNNYTPTVNKEPTAEDPKVFLSTDVIADEFMKMFPNVKIEWSRSKGTDWPYWMTTQVASDTAPDIVFLHGAQHADRGWFIRLNEELEKPNVFVEGNEKWKDQFPEYLWDSYMTSDAANNILAVPYTLYAGTATAYYYNKTIFKKLNITPPREWNQFVKDCKKINEAGYISVAPWSANKTISIDVWDIQFSLGPTYAMNMVDKWDLDGNKSMSPNELLQAIYRGEFNAKNNPAVLDMYAKVKEKYTDVLQTGADSTDYEALWNKGQVAMMEDGLWRLPQEEANTQRDFEYGVMPVPVATTKTSKYATDVKYEKGPYQPPICVSLNIVKSAIEDKSGGKDACVKFLQWLTKPENLDMVVLEAKGDGIGAVRGTQIPPELNEWFSEEFPRIPNAQWVSTGPTDDSKRKMSKQLEMWIRGMIDDETFVEGYDKELKSGADKLIKALDIDTKNW